MSDTLLADDRPVARIEHRCDDCGRTIRAGERYRRARAVRDGSAYTWKSCAHCDRVGEAIWRVVLPYDDEGICIEDWLVDYGVEPLLTQFRSGWAGVDPDALDLSVIR